MDLALGHKTLRKGDTALKNFAEHPIVNQFYLKEVVVSIMDIVVSCNH